MKKSPTHLLSVLMACLPALGLAAPVQRVVSLDLCTDWMLARHAGHAQVAGLSPLNRQYPVPWLDSSWPVHDGTLEQVLQLAPDLVITGEYNAFLMRTRLQTLGVRVEILPLPKTLTDITTYEKRLLGLLGLPVAGASIAPPAARPTAPRKRLLLLGANGIGTGRATFENGVMEHAGWTNYLQDEGYIQLDLERIATDPPDAILWAAPTSQALANRFADHPVLQRAVPEENWFSTDYWRWQCPGPWTWDLIRQLNQWLD